MNKTASEERLIRGMIEVSARDEDDEIRELVLVDDADEVFTIEPTRHDDGILDYVNTQVEVVGKVLRKGGRQMLEVMSVRVSELPPDGFNVDDFEPTEDAFMRETQVDAVEEDETTDEPWK